MSKGEIKREKLFNKYSDNLYFLKNNNKIDNNLSITTREYICPICLDKFTNVDLQRTSENPLTLEDAPAKSLGGSQIVLTCKKCNNLMGIDIDWHLTERLRELDYKDKIVGSEQNGQFTLGDITINGKIEVRENGVTTAIYPEKNNNPVLLEQYLHLIKTKKNPFFVKTSTRVDSKKLQIALLKNAYLLLFEKFGYSFLFDSEYDRIREQLQEPTKNAYPLKCWFYGPFPKDKIGVFFITENDMESIFVLFELKTKLSSRMFGVILPLSSTKIENVLANLEARFIKEKRFELQMSDYSDDYLTDIESVTLLLDWMKKYK